MARIPLAGGEQAILEPWRTARAFIRDLGLDSTTERIAWPWLPEFSAADRIVQTMLERKINTPLSSSCGRLFDAVAAVLGLVTTISYEGQGAIRLENIQDHGSELGDLYECPLRPDGNLMVLDTKKLFAQVCRDWLTKINAGIIAARFHQSLARGIADWALDAAQKTGLKTVVLSGGVLQNATLAALLPAELRQKGLSPALHVQIPPNDACISLGQAWYGLCVLRRKKNEQVDYV
jgi:hydrogenase maturation protein HypF